MFEGRNNAEQVTDLDLSQSLLQMYEHNALADKKRYNCSQNLN